MKKDTLIYLVLVIIVALIIVGILWIKNNNVTPEEKTMKCIASKLTMYSQTTCIHCKQQKEILGEYVSLFKIIECDKTPQLCGIEGLGGTPTWEFDGKLYPGVKSIKELADLSGCECNANINVLKNDTETCTVGAQDQNCTKPAETICTK
jgi:hypothetical protein